jgi:hypothetical protein
MKSYNGCSSTLSAAIFSFKWPGMYLSLALRNSVFLDVVETYEQTRPEYVDYALQQLETKQVRYVLWSPPPNHADVDRYWADHLEPLRSYLSRRYPRLRVFSDKDELWERR